MITKSPLLVGSGEKEMLGYSFVVKNGYAYRVDINRFLDEVVKSRKGTIEDVVNEIVNKMNDQKKFEMSALLKEYNIPPENACLYKIESQSQREQVKGSSLVHLFIKDPIQHKVYIPGSTIKGAMRKYYEGYKLKTADKKTKEIEKLIKILEDLKSGISDRKKKNDHEENKDELKYWLDIFTVNGKRMDPLVRDAMPVKPTSEILVLSYLQIHTKHEDKIAQQVDNIFGEYVKPGVEFNVEFGRVEKDKLEEVFQGVNEYCMGLANREKKYFEEHGGNSYSTVTNFYDSLKPTKGEYIFRIGMGSSFLFTSLLPALEEHYREIGGDIKDIYRMVLPKKRRENTTIPNSRKLAKINNKLLPLGWVGLRIEG